MNMISDDEHMEVSYEETETELRDEDLDEEDETSE